MFDLNLIALILGFVGCLAVAYGFGRMQERIKNLQANYGHTGNGRAQHDTAEALLFQISTAWADQKIASERLEYVRRLAIHIANGGNPDAKPAEWINPNPNGGKS